MERISATIDRIQDLQRDYVAAVDEPKLRLKISAELRLQDASLARLLKQVKTEPPQPESLRTIKARAAARARWVRDARL